MSLLGWIDKKLIMMTKGWRRRQFFLEVQRMEVTFGDAEEVLSSAAITEEVTLATTIGEWGQLNVIKVLFRE